ncbi:MULTISPECIES: class I SAM-dependent methyltransferase [unclassified Herbaspirillum]|uniref:class I SAM-dependent methyltransferase n=1 Tax=unclassified Herbaspirillum TaxID=2624150 RepID=UPI001152CEE8|nr:MULTISPECIES: class I SAM-dependent methyltransferase [unclassified Herbaspirillum]MBB5390095.1 hypothetical protein [Herbaspirillum sp. SJZ102]TQK09406.1 methyltransferase family protein [Herbaspirillum sp. SJZ130]TQK13907.1 methyltransferase family protein [Herbaspirillum sp. SJZ106]TWC69631.1 methyltransferase family protein [Herbaspirillum sp. SJZ099]
MDDSLLSGIHLDVAHYYNSKLTEYGATARGVDWNSETSQFQRFEELSKILPRSENFSLNDFGCGYGAFLEYAKNRLPMQLYMGNDISAEMIHTAQTRYGHLEHTHFSQSAHPASQADFTIASGIFNLRQGRDDTSWLQYILSTLDILNAYSKKGFSFNCLTSYSDSERMRPDLLYYADPCFLFDYCKRNYSRQIALLHDYGLYEFTILVRKDA